MAWQQQRFFASCPVACGAAIAAISIGAIATRPAEAIVIVESSNGTAVDSRATGQSVTTPAGDPWINIQFNFFDFSSTTGFTPAAATAGSLYLLDQEYLGLPGDLGSATGLLAQTGAISAGVWSFDASVTLQPTTQYWFYADTEFDKTVSFFNAYGGGSIYLANSGSSFQNFEFSDVNFRLQGTPVPSPLPVMGLFPVAVALRYRRRLRKRAAGAK